MQKNKITILIPCYNKEKFYSRLFKTLLKQKDQRFNIIFLNDASIDNTFDILNKFKKNNLNKNIKIINLEKQVGIAEARNILINNCESEYFYFIDADDFISKNTIKNLNNIIYKEDKEIVLSNFRTLIKKINVFNFLVNPFVKIKNNIDYLQKGIFFVWNVLINKKWFLDKNILFKPNFIYEDFSVSIPLILSAQNFTYINKFAYSYDLNLGGASKKHNSFKIESIAENINYLYSNLENMNLYSQFKQHKIEKHFLSYIWIHMFFAWNYKKIIKNFEQFKPSLNKLINIDEKYNIEKKLKKIYKTKNLFFKNAFNNYIKVKKILKKNKTLNNK
ncbi:glycosyltransferase family 2 protein [Mesomycoplasma neurolyticum]|uniref:Poly-beta-1,6-N-acetyl-D-glucosamine synthase n=1 Tax=Mesomycoplasma neurolyticum TaxID=2120 RepID=A0A449A4A9_9BACT|nr:glycosyltransferase family 2 protein [Mesomycoplasma neurolyticum]VEU59091.1 Poly-beta-1,6-N-acetyl-D-glucosamine synthase [Mesomycoplasma neurolyticum]